MAINRRKAAIPATIAGAFLLTLAAGAAEAGWSHGVAMHGNPALPPDFSALPYADPQAPKGGRLAMAVLGTFDSLNPFIIRGTFAPGLYAYQPQTGGFVFESLMKRNLAEPFTLYGLVAESIDMPEDRGSVTFRINPAARFSDGHPITADDVIFSVDLMRDHGRPNHRYAFGLIAKSEKLGEHEVRFEFTDSTNRELPLILALAPVLPKHAIDPATFEETSLKPPVGSGPYTVAEVNPGNSILYRRNPDYWGKDLPINNGLYRFDEIRYDMFRDGNSMFAAFRRGLVDVRLETDATQWLTGYDFPAVHEGQVIKETFDTEVPKGMSAFAFNTRRPLFSDQKVREALTLLFDFGWVNRNLYGGVYVRTESYFHGSELAALGRPADEHERTLLAPFPDAVNAQIMNGTWNLPASEGRGRDRDALREALRLLHEAGYKIEDTVLVAPETGEPVRFEMLVQSRDQERIALNYSETLKRVGITVTIRQADTVQFEQRRKTFDFDMMPFAWPASLSPGIEQQFRWSSAAAETQGSFNLPGIKSKAVDAMIGALLGARSREDFVSSVRALDRALLSGFYVLPLFHRPAEWVARWARIRHPETEPLNGFALETWWNVEGTKP